MKTKTKKVTLKQARRVLEVVDAGLSNGLGRPEPGEMCVEAAVTFALGENFGDDPSCVAPAVRAFKITLNDQNWSSNAERAKGMRRIAIAQLGTRDEIDEVAFTKELAFQTIRQIVPIALQAAAKLHHDPMHKTALEVAAIACETAKDLAAARAASYAASYAASNASYAASNASYAASNASYAASNASYAASNASNAASNASDAASDASDATSDASYPTSYASYPASYAARAARAASNASNAASNASDARNKVLGLMAEIGVQALKMVGAAGVKLMEKLIKS